jgi:hypothetical protein
MKKYIHILKLNNNSNKKMESIRNLNDFKQYVNKSDINDEIVVYDILGFTVANNDHKMFDYFANEVLSEEMKENVRKTLKTPGEDMYNKWAEKIKITPIKTSIDISGDTSIDNDPIERAFNNDDGPWSDLVDDIMKDDPLSKLVDDVLNNDEAPTEPKTVYTYSFAPEYDTYYNVDNNDVVSDVDHDDDESSEDDFIEKLEKSLNI